MDVELKDGSLRKRWHVIKDDAVAVVCVKGDHVILLREYRSASQTVEWNLPSGTIRQGEDPIAAAVRETREEIGLEPLDLRLVEVVQHPSGTIRQNTHCFVATEFNINPLSSGEPEEAELEVRTVPLEKVKSMLNNFEIPQRAAELLTLGLGERVEASEPQKLENGIALV